MTLTDFYRLGVKSAHDSHTAGDDVPTVDDLLDSLRCSSIVDDLERMPTHDEACAYVQGWIDLASSLNRTAHVRACAGL